MSECHRLRKLQDEAADASLRAKCLLDQSPRLAGITGLSEIYIADAISRSLENRKRACAALALHIRLHGCAPLNCCWPEPDCDGCRLRVGMPGLPG